MFISVNRIKCFYFKKKSISFIKQLFGLINIFFVLQPNFLKIRKFYFIYFAFPVIPKFKIFFS